jgi:outer membrane protein, heavy metal efflux system
MFSFTIGTCTKARLVGALTLLALVCAGGDADAQQVELTRGRIVQLLADAPDSRASEAKVGVSKAAVTAASVLSLENPQISASGGVRFNPDGSRRLAGAAALSWPVDTGGKRGDRVEAASAEHRDARATGNVQRQRLLLALLLRHAMVLRDAQQVALAEARSANAQKVLATAMRRREAGSVPPIDVSLATLQQGRDAAAALSARGEQQADTARLAALLGLTTEEIGEVTGRLVPEDEPPPLDAMLRQLDKRADMQAATARVQAARARASRERSAASPTVSILAQYERDEGANIGTLGVAVPLGLLNANAVSKATSQAEAHAARAERESIRAAASGEIREHYARYVATKLAREALAPTAAAVSESVSLTTRAYELGEGDLAGVLLVHREALEAQRALLEAEYAHAVAKLELLISAGRTPQ